MVAELKFCRRTFLVALVDAGRITRTRTGVQGANREEPIRVQGFISLGAIFARFCCFPLLLGGFGGALVDTTPPRSSQK